MLKITDKKRAAGTMDQQVKSLVSQICRLWDRVEDLERLFALKIKEIKQMNQVRAEHSYVLEKQGSDTILVWHVDLNCNKDRLLCEVSYVADE